MPMIPFGPATTLTKSGSQGPVEFQGTTTFVVPPAQTYRYSLSLENGKFRISLEDCGSKNQWCTSELELESYVDSSNSIPDTCASDYVECFHELLAQPLSDTSKPSRTLQIIDGDQVRLEIYVKVHALMKSRVVTYTFDLEAISVERIDVLESKVSDLQEEVRLLRAEATGKGSVVQEMKGIVLDLRAEMKVLREAVKPPGFFLARASSQLGTEGVILWRCEGLKVVDGVVKDLSPGVYQVGITVDFEGRSSRMQLNKGAQLVCHTSGFQQLSMSSIIHVNKGDKLSVQANGHVVAGFMTLALLAELSV